jgi:FAD/FMN-containing dehydrogenase
MVNQIINYDGSITAYPRQLVYPETVQEIQDILRNTTRFPSPVRAMGSHHSLTPCASSDGTIINMSRMNRIIGINKAAGTITAEAGVQFIDAANRLQAEQLQFMTNIEIGNLTLGAAACCQTKDGLDGVEYGQVNSYVTGIKWVAPDGQLFEASDSTSAGDLPLLRSSYGLAGVIYQVTLRVKPLEIVHFRYLPRPIKDLTQNEVDTIVSSPHGVVCWTIGNTAHFQLRETAKQQKPPGSAFASLRRSLWNHTEARAARFIDKSVPWPLKHYALNGWFLGNRAVMLTLNILGGVSLSNPDKIIDYRSTPASARYAFTFWAFPRSQWVSTLREYTDFADRHYAQYGFRCNMPLGSYYIRQDTSSILSYSYNQDVFSIDPIHAYTNKADWERFLQHFNEFASTRGGIPLLNQSPFVEKRHVQAAYGARWQHFSQWVRQQDPNKRMLNPFFEALL